jgi:hypothetical protein
VPGGEGARATGGGGARGHGRMTAGLNAGVAVGAGATAAAAIARAGALCVQAVEDSNTISFAHRNSASRRCASGPQQTSHVRDREQVAYP